MKQRNWRRKPIESDASIEAHDGENLLTDCNKEDCENEGDADAPIGEKFGST